MGIDTLPGKEVSLSAALAGRHGRRVHLARPTAFGRSQRPLSRPFHHSSSEISQKHGEHPRIPTGIPGRRNMEQRRSKIEVVVEIVTENLGLDYQKRGFPTYTYDPATTPVPKYFFLGSRRHQPLERGPRIFRLRDRPPAKSAR